MSYASLMVNVNHGHVNQGVLNVTSQLATRLHAEVIGVAASRRLKMLYGESLLSAEPFEHDRERIEKQMKEAETHFNSALKTSGARLRWRSTMAFESPADWVAREACSADLLIAGIIFNSSFDATRHVDISDLVMRIGRPVLLVPESVENLRLDRVVVGWSDARESMRAIADALPLLKHAVHVSLVEIAATPELTTARSHLGDVAIWLTGHGVKAETFSLTPKEFDHAQLRVFAHDDNADLIVAGAYGHSRLREWALGGVTRDLLLHSDRCMLLSH